MVKTAFFLAGLRDRRSLSFISFVFYTSQIFSMLVANNNFFLGSLAMFVKSSVLSSSVYCLNSFKFLNCVLLQYKITIKTLMTFNNYSSPYSWASSVLAPCITTRKWWMAVKNMLAHNACLQNALGRRKFVKVYQTLNDQFAICRTHKFLMTIIY